MHLKDFGISKLEKRLQNNSESWDF